jgi:hypothetical protein
MLGFLLYKKDFPKVEMMLFACEYSEPCEIKITFKDSDEEYLYETRQIGNKLLLVTK